MSNFERRNRWHPGTPSMAGVRDGGRWAGLSSALSRCGSGQVPWSAGPV